MGKLTPVLLSESTDIYYVCCFRYFFLNFSDLEVQFGLWSGSQLIREQNIRSLDFFLCYHCCLVEVIGLVFCLLIGSCPLLPDFLFQASFLWLIVKGGAQRTEAFKLFPSACPAQCIFLLPMSLFPQLSPLPGVRALSTPKQ